LMGYSGVYSSFLINAVRLLDRHGVAAFARSFRHGLRNASGEQEGLLTDIALEIKRELDSGAAGTH
ncbi:4-hydroxy-2-oxovalerate aldolase, partial [Mycolicibacterium goodii]|uniref:4-hydroxy-2-oxovalerate aldolase n=1 Tax=Mycolicibacterium goodii TaxID=134601 RepID=UPI001BDC4C08